MLAHGEGKEGGLVAGEKVVATLLKVPALVFEDALETSLLKVARKLRCEFNVKGMQSERDRGRRDRKGEGKTHRQRGRVKGSD